MLRSITGNKIPNELIDLEKILMNEIEGPQQKIQILELPFYNFVCSTIEILTQFTQINMNITFNLFLVDYYVKIFIIKLRKFENNLDVYRHFIGYLSAWKKYIQTDEVKLFLTFLKPNRN
jgi:hypothetical protein